MSTMIKTKIVKGAFDAMLCYVIQIVPIKVHLREFHYCVRCQLYITHYSALCCVCYCRVSLACPVVLVWFPLRDSGTEYSKPSNVLCVCCIVTDIYYELKALSEQEPTQELFSF